MKHVIKSISAYIFVIVLSMNYTSSVNAFSCEEIKKDQKTLKEDPGYYYFKIGLCDFELINNNQQFDVAVDALTKSSKYDYTPSYFALGILYEHRFKHGSEWLNEKGGLGDLLKSIENYKKAARNKSALAENRLGEIYLHQANLTEEYRSNDDSSTISGVSEILPNLSNAIYWFEEAAKHGNSAAQGTLADLYLRGVGVPQDFVMGYVWQNLSVASQFRYNKSMHDDEIGRSFVHSQRLISEKQYNKLTEMQKNEAQALSKEYAKLYFTAPTQLDEFCQATQTYITVPLLLKKLDNFK